MTDTELLRYLIAERKDHLNPNAPLYRRLSETYDRLVNYRLDNCATLVSVSRQNIYDYFEGGDEAEQQECVQYVTLMDSLNATEWDTILDSLGEGLGDDVFWSEQAQSLMYALDKVREQRETKSEQQP